MGDAVQVQCHASKGDIPLTFSWLFKGQPISSEMSIKVSSFGQKTSLLSIDYANEAHIGNFTCVAANRAGVSTYSAELFVKGT